VELAISTVSSPQLAHSKVRCSKPGLSGIMRIIIMSSPQLGHLRRVIGYLVDPADTAMGFPLVRPTPTGNSAPQSK
jgi:hypothetical protein